MAFAGFKGDVQKTRDVVAYLKSLRYALFFESGMLGPTTGKIQASAQVENAESSASLNPLPNSRMYMCTCGFLHVKTAVWRGRILQDRGCLVQTNYGDTMKKRSSREPVATSWGFGGRCKDRTLRPHPCEGCALPLS